MSKSQLYDKMVDRNIGLLTKDEQIKLKESTIAVLGVGGLGGVIAEILARCGVGKLIIVDNDHFEPTNLNRQIFCNVNSLGELKVDATKKYLHEINPDLVIETFIEVSIESAELMLKDSDVAVLAIDKTRPCLLVSRACREKGIPLVEGWALPFGNVRVFTKDTLSLEAAYNMPTAEKSLEEIMAMDEESFQGLDAHVLKTLSGIEGLDKFYKPEVVEQIFSTGRLTSFAPMVWLTAVMMALEATKVILDWGNLALAPDFAIYDPYSHKIPRMGKGE